MAGKAKPGKPVQGAGKPKDEGNYNGDGGVGPIRPKGAEPAVEPEEEEILGTVVATDESPFHKPGTVITAHPNVLRTMIKKGYAAEQKETKE